MCLAYINFINKLKLSLNDDIPFIIHLIYHYYFIVNMLDKTILTYFKKIWNQNLNTDIKLKIIIIIIMK